MLKHSLYTNWFGNAHCSLCLVSDMLNIMTRDFFRAQNTFDQNIYHDGQSIEGVKEDHNVALS